MGSDLHPKDNISLNLHHLEAALQYRQLSTIESMLHVVPPVCDRRAACILARVCSCLNRFPPLSPRCLVSWSEMLTFCRVSSTAPLPWCLPARRGTGPLASTRTTLRNCLQSPWPSAPRACRLVSLCVWVGVCVGVGVCSICLVYVLTQADPEQKSTLPSDVLFCVAKRLQE